MLDSAMSVKEDIFLSFGASIGLNETKNVIFRRLKTMNSITDRLVVVYYSEWTVSIDHCSASG